MRGTSFRVAQEVEVAINSSNPNPHSDFNHFRVRNRITSKECSNVSLLRYFLSCYFIREDYVHVHVLSPPLLIIITIMRCRKLQRKKIIDLTTSGVYALCYTYELEGKPRRGARPSNWQMHSLLWILGSRWYPRHDPAASPVKRPRNL